ncbi:Integral membrane protein 2B [Chionoecetes opilio]|uniref:Integral membrane protein 2 n=1 Tax=Chionoecetes opilio TaxID=41210 RepID=A0A8J5CWM2_CHIOP|nr:Integral membrane protein 2B [Chionoecetes opilio]
MTIVTKPKTDTKPLVRHEVESGECVVVDSKAAAAAAEEEVWLTAASGSRCRVSTATSVCVCLTALLVMSIGIIGGVYLYRQFSAHERSRFRGWCGIPYDHEDLLGHPKLPLGGNPAMYTGRRGMFKGDDNAEWISKSLFKEEFELDLEGNNYEEIHVPDFGLRRQGRFIHDFKVNKTGIIDLTSHRCFVMPLDRSHVLPPRSVYDLIKKMWMGYYSVNTQVVRETMHVVGPRIKDYQPLGVYIANYCASFPTYNLERHYVQHDVKKRSLDKLGAEEEEGIQFAEFAGKNIIHFIILGSEEAAQQ